MDGMDAQRCRVCADDVVAMRVVAPLDGYLVHAVPDDGGEHRPAEVEVSLVAPVRPGDVLLVQAGVAIALHHEEAAS